MKTGLTLLFSLILTLGNIDAQTLKPYWGGQMTEKNFTEAQSMVRESIKAQGLEILGEYFEINSANKTTASLFKKIWMAIKRTAVDIWAFPSCPYCGGFSPDPNVEPTPYDLGQAWNYAGEQSSQVE